MSEPRNDDVLQPHVLHAERWVSELLTADAEYDFGWELLKIEINRIDEATANRIWQAVVAVIEPSYAAKQEQLTL